MTYYIGTIYACKCTCICMRKYAIVVHSIEMHILTRRETIPYTGIYYQHEVHILVNYYFL